MSLHEYILVCKKELEARDKNLCLYLKMGVKEGSPPALRRESRRTWRGEGQRQGEPRECSGKIKTFLGLVSNLQQLSTHQRKTAYGKGTVRGCLLKRITALKGSEAKQRYEFRCSCRVMRRVDLGGNNTMEGAQALENTLCTYLSTHLSSRLSIAFIFWYWGKMLGNTLAVSVLGVPKASIIPLAGSKQALFGAKCECFSLLLLPKYSTDTTDFKNIILSNLFSKTLNTWFQRYRRRSCNNSGFIFLLKSSSFLYITQT